MIDLDPIRPTRVVHQFDAIAALHVLRSWAVERVAAHEGVTVLTSDHAVASFTPQYKIGVADDAWIAFWSTMLGQWERKCGRDSALRAIADSVAVVVPTESSARSTGSTR